MKGLTFNEIQSIAEQTRAYTVFPKAKKIMTDVINLLNDECPECGLNIYDNARIVYIREHAMTDMVTYICSNCGTVFRKLEIKDEEEID